VARWSLASGLRFGFGPGAVSRLSAPETFREARSSRSAMRRSASLEPDSKDNYRASRLTAIWMQANVTKAARVPARFSAKPRESSLDDPAARQDDKAFRVVAALDDFEAQHRNFGNGGFDLPRVVAIVRPDQFEPGKTVLRRMWVDGTEFNWSSKEVATQHA
jgi:hypothetical protein